MSEGGKLWRGGDRVREGGRSTSVEVLQTIDDSTRELAQ